VCNQLKENCISYHKYWKIIQTPVNHIFKSQLSSEAKQFRNKNSSEAKQFSSKNSSEAQLVQKQK